MNQDDQARHLAPVQEIKTVDARIKPAILSTHPDSRLDSQLLKHHPLADNGMVYRDMTDVESKKKSLHAIIAQLDVSHNLRYQKTPEDTYCNVYSFDYCHFSKVYLPTVWWTENSLKRVLNGEEVKPIMYDTVGHIYSNALHDWLLTWGISFGWQRMTSFDEAQRKVNEEGGVGIICAKRVTFGLSGHIVPIVPETKQKQAYRENGVVVYPLQSQAGNVNYNYFAKKRKDWWNHERYQRYVMYYHA